MSAVTQWCFDKPMRTGVYEMRHCLFQRWNGRFWGAPYETPQKCERNAEFEYPSWQNQFHGWRGLADKPAEKGGA